MLEFWTLTIIKTQRTLLFERFIHIPCTERIILTCCLFVRTTHSSFEIPIQLDIRFGFRIESIYIFGVAFAVANIYILYDCVGYLGSNALLYLYFAHSWIQWCYFQCDILLVIFNLDLIFYCSDWGLEQHVPLLSTSIRFHRLCITYTDSGSIMNSYAVVVFYSYMCWWKSHSPRETMQIISELKVLFRFEKTTNENFI